MIKYFAKKWIIKQINQLLVDIKDNEKVIYWKNKILDIIRFLNNIQTILEDNNISEDEADKVVEECKKLF